MALEVEKERESKEEADAGETFTSGQSAARRTLRPPDLCRKQKGEVLIMWSNTMCRSKKSRYDFKMSI